MPPEGQETEQPRPIQPRGFTPETLAHLFTHHPPQGDQAQRHQNIREAALVFAQTVVINTPTCADQTVAVRKIREAMLMASAAIAVNEPRE